VSLSMEAGCSRADETCTNIKDDRWKFLQFPNTETIG
jgi:hypothetical protein